MYIYLYFFVTYYIHIIDRPTKNNTAQWWIPRSINYAIELINSASNVENFISQ